MNELSGAIAGSDPTGNANMNQALGNIVSNVIVTGAGGAVGGESGAFSGYNVDRFNRQLHPDERQCAQDKAKDFAKFYEEKTGKAITLEQAQNMLLANGYRFSGWDGKQGAGRRPSGSRVYQSERRWAIPCDIGRVHSPFWSGNKDGTLTPEQKALPGAMANPKAGLILGLGFG